MTGLALGRRFLDSTRGQIVALLRRQARTVEELARALDLTDNAVRSQLSALERDGLVRQGGVRRGAGAGKPAVLYELHPDTGALFSRAYQPVLGTVLDVIVDELPEDRRLALLHEVGRRLARQLGGRRAATPELRARAAAAMLESLGGDVEVVATDGRPTIRGYACPLAAVVRHRPEVCNAVAAMVSEIADAPARSCCEHGEVPRCCFEIGDAA